MRGTAQIDAAAPLGRNIDSRGDAVVRADAPERATVTYDPSRTDAARLVEAVRAAGYDARVEETVLHVEGMEYAASAEPIERELRRVAGVVRVEANLATDEARVWFLPEAVEQSALGEAVERAGYRLAEPIAVADPVERERLAREREYRRLRGKLVLAAAVAVVAMLASMPLMMGPHATGGAELFDRLMMPLSDLLARALPWLYGLDHRALKWVLLLLTTPVVGWAGRQFYRGAWSGFLHRTADMNTLIAVGTGAAYLYSLVATVAPGLFARAGLPADVYFEAVSMIIALILLGKLMEARAKGRTSEAIRRLGQLQPRTARVVRDGLEQELALADLVPGDVVLVRPGDRIAVDGRVLDGASSVDESLLTAVEPCMSFEYHRSSDVKERGLKLRPKKCLHLYKYFVHPLFGFMNARIQTWFPFNVQVCLNGREWLARPPADAAGGCVGAAGSRAGGCVADCQRRPGRPVAAGAAPGRRTRRGRPAAARGVERGVASGPGHALAARTCPGCAGRGRPRRGSCPAGTAGARIRDHAGAGP